MASSDGPQSPPIPLGDRVVQYETHPPLDPSLYALSPSEAAFFKAATGIDDDAALKERILMVQEKAYKLETCFDPAVLSVASSNRAVPPSPRPDLSALTSLNPLRGHCSVINASAFFHLFTEEKQLHVARALAGLLSSEPGSLICGAHLGAQEPTTLTDNVLGGKFELFRHSPKSWEAMWDGVFTVGEVKVEASLNKIEFMNQELQALTWSVTRL
ncbi:hypothetical protein BU15DRAFT_74167 [Melanogaster broomeanus]|nr:hypothetical protein BU15DRAFT_74167 [Melanogaster broomeanus]